MPDYEQAKIYKLWSPQGDEIYIGSTTQSLALRKAGHKHRQNCCCKILFQKYDDVRIELIEEFPCKNKMELERREGELIRTNDCVNRCIAGRTHKEYRKDNKEQIREYYEKNKQKLLEYQKEYREKNKEQIREKQKEYCEDNKEKIREKQKEYRENNREKKKEYYEKNKEKRKEYLEKNKEKIRQKDKEYYEKNKQKIIERQREYREKNKKNI